MTNDQVEEAASELRTRMTFDSLFEQTDKMIYEILDYPTEYGKITQGIPKYKEFEMIKLKSYCWEIEIPRRIQKTILDQKRNREWRVIEGNR